METDALPLSYTPVGEAGWDGWVRTSDTEIFNHLLYHLSYDPPLELVRRERIRTPTALRRLVYSQMGSLMPSLRSYETGWIGRLRSCDHLINSEALYQLSYDPMLVAGAGLEPTTPGL